MTQSTCFHFSLDPLHFIIVLHKSQFTVTTLAPYPEHYTLATITNQQPTARQYREKESYCIRICT